MSASDHLNDDQFKFIRASGSNPEATSQYHKVVDPRQHQNMLAWDKDSGEVLNIHTHENQRRQGVATRMWSRAHAESAADPEVVPPKHSAIRSGKGDKWAKAVGGELPERDLEKSYRGDE